MSQQSFFFSVLFECHSGEVGGSEGQLYKKVNLGCLSELLCVDFLFLCVPAISLTMITLSRLIDGGAIGVFLSR